MAKMPNIVRIKKKTCSHCIGACKDIHASKAPHANDIDKISCTYTHDIIPHSPYTHDIIPLPLPDLEQF